MAKLGENTPHIIDATVDFMASSQAFREYLKKLPPDNTIPPALSTIWRHPQTQTRKCLHPCSDSLVLPRSFARYARS